MVKTSTIWKDIIIKFIIKDKTYIDYLEDHIGESKLTEFEKFKDLISSDNWIKS